MEEFFEHHALPYTYSQFKSLGIVSVNCLQGVKDERSLKRPQGNVKLYSQINDAHYYADATQKMFATWYNVRPFRGRVHVVTHADFCNAFALPPALDSKGKPLYPDEPEQFWVGTGYMTEDKEVCAAGLATADVVAHELGHLVTGHYSNLIYDGQSGGINEAFSDMTGMALQDFLYEQYHWATYGYWIGGQVFMFSPYYLRSMAYPEADGSSISQFSAYSDESDVHYTSGIFNKAFYNLAEEHQWGVKKAYQLMLTANMNYWTEHERKRKERYQRILQQTGRCVSALRLVLSCPM
jgi:pseudolysin